MTGVQTCALPIYIVPAGEEDRRLWARNKWLLAHPESSEAAQGAWVGLTGRNIDLQKEV